MIRLRIFFPLICFYFLFSTSPVFAENGLDQAHHYINKINSESTKEEFVSFWVKPIQERVFNTPEKLDRAFNEAVKMHKVFLSDNSANNTPTVFSPMEGTVSYTFLLNNTIPMNYIYPNSSHTETSISEYQITMQIENGVWKVTVRDSKEKAPL